MSLLKVSISTPLMRAGVLQYSLNQHRVSFGFFNSDLTLGNLKTSRWQRAHSQVAALNA